MKTSLFICCLFLLYACQNPLHNKANDYGDEFELSLGEKLIIGKDKVSVEFVDVLEDSRCPSNVTCVWAGNGKVQLRFDSKDIELNTYLDPKDSTISEVNIQLISLEPYPESPVQIEKEDYTVRLMISKE